MLTGLSVVDGVEENHRSDDDLEEWSNSSALGLSVLVLPSPESATQCSHECSWGLFASRQPSSDLSNFGLSEWNVS